MRTVILAALLLLSVNPGPVQAAATIQQVGTHLRSLASMTADFAQSGANGAVSRGKLILARPGRVRFQYEPSVPLLIVADGKALTMIDYEVAQVTRWPIRGTPLAILLDPTIDISRLARIVSTAGQTVPGFTVVEARDPKHPEYGTITLYFAGDPAAPGGLRLAAWRVLDAQGNTTQVELSNVRFGVPVDRSMFTWRDPRARARPPGKG